MTPTPDMLALARRIADKVSPGHADTPDWARGRLWEGREAIAIAAIIATQEACAKVAENCIKMISIRPGIGPLTRENQVVDEVTDIIAAAIRAGKHYGGEG